MKTILCIFIALTILASCTDDGFYNKDGILLDKFNITLIDTTILSKFMETVKLEVDLDGDTKKDIAFLLYGGYSAGGVNWKRSKIKLLRNYIKFPMIELVDTSLYCVYNEFIDNDTLVSQLSYNTLSGIHCSNILKETIKSIDTLYTVKEHQNLDSLTLTDYCWGEMIVLADYWSTLRTYQFQNGVFIGFNQFRYIQNFLNNQEFYLYFTSEATSEIKHGWIKMSVTDYNTIYIEEIAIEI